MTVRVTACSFQLLLLLVVLFLSGQIAQGQTVAELMQPSASPLFAPLKDTGFAPPQAPLIDEQVGDIQFASTAGGEPTSVVRKIAADDAPGEGKRLSVLEKGYDDLAKKFKAFSEKSAASEFPSAKLTGFTQLDTACYSQTPNNKLTVGDAQNGTGFRRARLAVQGKVAEFTAYQLEMDFATAGRPSFFDNYIDQSNLPFLGTVRIGQYCQPFSVDALTGFRNLTFLERSLPFLTFVPFRRVGAMAYNMTENQRTAWAYGVYRTGGFNNAPLGDDRFGTDFGDGNGYSFSGRATHLMYYDDLVPDRYLWHIGGGYNFSVLGQNTAANSGVSPNAGGGPAPFYQARTLPEFGTLGLPENGSTFGTAVNGTPSFLDSGRYEASAFHLWGLETVAQWGPWGFTSEWMATQVNSVVGPIYYNGAYAQLAYRLTGEHRSYDKRSGTLTKLVPFTNFISLKPGGVCGWGAWEIGARWSYVDVLNPANLSGHYYNSTTNTYNGSAVASASGVGAAGNGALNDSTIGLTWFLNTHTKVQFNWIHAMLNNRVQGFSQADLYVSRFQVDF